MADLSITATEIAPVEILEQHEGKAGVTITAGQMVMEDTDGRFILADASAAGTARPVGMALSGGVANTPITALRKGLVEVGDAVSALNAGVDIYLSDTAGALGTTAGTVSKICGQVRALHGNPVDKILRLDL